MHFVRLLVTSLILSATEALLPARKIYGNTDLSPCDDQNYTLVIDYAESYFDNNNNYVFVWLGGITDTAIKDGAFSFLSVTNPDGDELLEDNYSVCDDFGVKCPIDSGAAFHAAFKFNVQQALNLSETIIKLEIFPPYSGKIEPSLLCLNGSLAKEGSDDTTLHLQIETRQHWEM